MPKPGTKIWGYEVRDPYDSERSYFQQNPKVTGMAAGSRLGTPRSLIKSATPAVERSSQEKA